MCWTHLSEVVRWHQKVKASQKSVKSLWLLAEASNSPTRLLQLRSEWRVGSNSEASTHQPLRFLSLFFKGQPPGSAIATCNRVRTFCVRWPAKNRSRWEVKPENKILARPAMCESKRKNHSFLWGALGIFLACLLATFWQRKSGTREIWDLTSNVLFAWLRQMCWAHLSEAVRWHQSCLVWQVHIKLKNQPFEGLVFV